MLMVEKLGIINIKQFCEDVCKIVGISTNVDDVDMIGNSSEDEIKVKVKPTKSEKVCPIKILPNKQDKNKVTIAEEDDKITMSDRKSCPVKVVPMENKKVNVKTGKDTNKFDETLTQFINELDAKGIKFKGAKRVDTGLVEVKLIKADGNVAVISVDIDNKIYGIGYNIFFIGKIPALAEYDNSKPIILNDDTINAIINNIPIEEKFYVPENFVIMNRLVDMTSLKETNMKKREKVLTKAAKALETLNDEIVKTANNEPFRFVFAKYESENKFSLVSSKRNLVSNLSKNKLNTEKEIWIHVDRDDVTLKYNPKK